MIFIVNSALNNKTKGRSCSIKIFKVKKSDLNNGISFNDLIIKINFAKSNGEYRRNIANKGYRINNEIVTDEKKKVTKEDFNGEKVIKVSFGKKQHVLIEAI